MSGEPAPADGEQHNVLGGRLVGCSTDPVTGWYRDGTCRTDDADLGSHTVCAVMSAEFLDHQRSIGNDLLRPMPAYDFPGLTPGDRWCVTAHNWLRAHEDGVAAPVVLEATNEAVLGIVPLAVLREHAVDVPDDASDLLGGGDDAGDPEAGDGSDTSGDDTADRDEDTR